MASPRGATARRTELARLERNQGSKDVLGKTGKAYAMTDENLLNTEQSQGISNASIDSIGADYGASSPSATQKQEGYVPQSRVNEIMQAEKKRAYEKGLQDASQRVQPQQQQSPDNAQQLNESRIRDLIKQEAEAIERKRYEEAQRLQQEQEAQRLYSDLHNKFNAHRKVDPKLDEKLAEVDYFNGMPGVQYVLNQFDDAGALAVHLRENMANASHIEQLARYRDRNGAYNPKFAIEEMRRISDRLKQNEAARTSPVPSNPISQVETTIRDGMGNSGLPDLQALKNNSRFMT